MDNVTFQFSRKTEIQRFKTKSTRGDRSGRRTNESLLEKQIPVEGNFTRKRPLEASLASLVGSAEPIFFFFFGTCSLTRKKVIARNRFRSDGAVRNLHGDISRAGTRGNGQHRKARRRELDGAKISLYDKYFSREGQYSDISRHAASLKNHRELIEFYTRGRRTLVKASFSNTNILLEQR